MLMFWLMAQPQTCAIAGFRHAEQAADNAIAAQVHLSADDLAEIDAIGRIVTDHLDDNPVMWEWSV
jgi:myo-inositol catabolism protein IolS